MKLQNIAAGLALLVTIGCAEPSQEWDDNGSTTTVIELDIDNGSSHHKTTHYTSTKPVYKTVKVHHVRKAYFATSNELQGASQFELSNWIVIFEQSKLWKALVACVVRQVVHHVYRDVGPEMRMRTTEGPAARFEVESGGCVPAVLTGLPGHPWKGQIWFDDLRTKTLYYDEAEALAACLLEALQEMRDIYKSSKG
jgi:hypothetical protein